MKTQLLKDTLAIMKNSPDRFDWASTQDYECGTKCCVAGFMVYISGAECESGVLMLTAAFEADLSKEEASILFLGESGVIDGVRFEEASHFDGTPESHKEALEVLQRFIAISEQRDAANV